MDISVFFEAVNVPDEILQIDPPARIYHQLKIYDAVNLSFPDYEEAQIAIIGVQEDRNSLGNEGTALSPDFVRNYFYKLYSFHKNLRIVDLGNIKAAYTIEDTYHALTEVVATLLRKNVLPIVIGGSQDLTYPIYLAYEQLGRILNLVCLDKSFDLGNSEEELHAESFLSKIILHEPNYLFNYTNIGYQSYFVDPRAIDLMKQMCFDIYRLGDVRADLEEVEPMIRNADILSIDITAVRQSDAPASAKASPNGFYGEELCKIARYAGLSDKLSMIGFFENNPAFDKHGQTSHLIAQMMWYFMEGFCFRKNDLPHQNKSEFKKYKVLFKEQNQEVTFYKSKKSDRWWMEVPCPSSLREKYKRHYLLPCSYNDYQTASKEELPDRWLQAYQKLL